MSGSIIGTMLDKQYDSAVKMWCKGVGNCMT